MNAVAATYLGFPLTITDQAVFVRTPEGRLVAAVPSMKQARLLVKGYRKASKEAT